MKISMLINLYSSYSSTYHENLSQNIKKITIYFELRIS